MKKAFYAKFIVVVAIVAAIVLGMTGCSKQQLGSKKSASKNVVSMKSESAYIDVWDAFIPYDSSLYDEEISKEGKAYTQTMESLSNADELLSITNAIIFDNGVFEQYGQYYFSEDGSTARLYEGEYSLSDDNRLIFDYQKEFQIYLDEKIEELYVDTRIDEENYRSRSERAILSNMTEWNESNCVSVQQKFFHLSDKWIYFISPTCERDSSVLYYTYNTSWYELYSKNNYIVGSATNYTLDSSSDSSEFVLESEREDKSGKYSQVTEFFDDNTYKRVSINSNGVEDGAISGTWELYDDNLLLVFASDEEMERYKTTSPSKYSIMYMYYLDFDEEEVYIPAFIRCDDMLEIAENKDYERDMSLLTYLDDEE